MSINVDGPALQAVVAAAILREVGPEKRDELMTAAIKYLLTPGVSSGYSRTPTPSPLQDAFQNAVRSTANEIIREEMARPEYREKLQGVVQEAMMRALEGGAREVMVSRMSDALSTALTEERR